MLSRRDILIGTGMAGAAALARPVTNAFAIAAQPKTPVNFTVPDGACDSHTCIVADPAKFPLAADRGYTPETASLDEMRSVHRALHIQRVVIVQPSFYGTDSSCTLDTVKQLGPNARGVVLIPDNATNADLDQLVAAEFAESSAPPAKPIRTPKPSGIFLRSPSNDARDAAGTSNSMAGCRKSK